VQTYEGMVLTATKRSEIISFQTATSVPSFSCLHVSEELGYPPCGFMLDLSSGMPAQIDRLF